MIKNIFRAFAVIAILAWTVALFIAGALAYVIFVDPSVSDVSLHVLHSHLRLCLTIALATLTLGIALARLALHVPVLDEFDTYDFTAPVERKPISAIGKFAA